MSQEAASIRLHVNGAVHDLFLPGKTKLLFVLRNDLGLNGPKYGCGLGECGACMVLVDGRGVRACCVPLSAVAGRTITTLEGLTVDGAPGQVQRAFITEQAAQCGYCLNGMIIATESLLRRVPHPTEQQIRDELSHNLCRCGTHMEILAAIRRAATDRAG
jgi:nicotinate dehydrogenase subunit A